MSYNAKVHIEQGGNRGVVASGGSFDVESGGEIDIESGGALKLAGTAITSTAAELNILDTVTATATQLNYLAGVTPGTQAASKAVVANADVNTGISKVTELHIGATGAETQVTATAAELNIMSGVTATSLEINNQCDGSWATFTTAATPASGSCAVQFVFKDAAGVTMAVPVAGTFYLSEVSTGLTRDPADTSVAVLTNGVVQNIDAAVHNGWHFVTSAAGLLGITITAAADDYYVVFLKPNGLLAISTVCTVNA